MEGAIPHTIFTIGHSNRSIEMFISMLRENNVQTLVDVRSFPGSKNFPQYNKAALEVSLRKTGIAYLHAPDLGGKRDMLEPDKKQEDSGLKGYESHMETEVFANAIQLLQDLARMRIVAYMCAEAQWWKCHRRYISSYLARQDWQVLHILSPGKVQKHADTEGLLPVQTTLF